MKPSLSVVMPHYNQEEFIKNSINSILNQTFQDWELIIVDDGSDDFKIQSIINEFKDTRIKFYQLPHQGLVTARNFGTKMAEANWIVVQDADDLSMPNRLERINELKDDYDVIVHSLYINMWNEQFNCINREYRRVLPVDIERIKKEQYLPGVTAYRKSLWEKKPFRYETEFAFDWMMWLDWILSGAKIKVLDEGLYEYVRHTGSASQTYENDGRRQKSFEKIKEIIKNEYE